MYCKYSEIRELFDFSILTFQNLGGNMLFFAQVLQRLELFAKLEAILPPFSEMLRE